MKTLQQGMQVKKWTAPKVVRNEALLFFYRKCTDAELRVGLLDFFFSPNSLLTDFSRYHYIIFREKNNAAWRQFGLGSPIWKYLSATIIFIFVLSKSSFSKKEYSSEFPSFMLIEWFPLR